MSTPGAIAVYTSGSGVPERVSERPWRGVYHHWDGYPSGLGQHLMARVQRAQGDMQAVVRQLIDEAPWGWSHCMPGPKAPEGQRHSEEGAGPRVTPDETGAVAYVYVFDLEARRLDAFSTCVGDDGERISSVVFSPTGTPDLPALDLLPEEAVSEPPLPGKELSPQALKDCLDGLPVLKAGSSILHWVTTEQRPDDALSITLRVVTFEEEVLTSVVEQEWDAVPPSARLEPERVRHFLEALVEVVSEDSRRLDAFWISAQDSLRRSGARQRGSFAKILRAHAARDFGSDEGS
ncbi:hypothetical protein D7V80_02475 [Corallococcus sp. CA054B]|uniref:hypothetical protein n=1 Tax=Corallococcus sp. CA054B TaxID=2316734 RepID=UPI000EA2EF95|nr:hypothetical protein [Corallococcus sp. CA054B]RKG71235.1 hypothetical protein D7V80_02475 [Corallococcus sp. CA054B]